jgi:hypothetical protein
MGSMIVGVGVCDVEMLATQSPKMQQYICNQPAWDWHQACSDVTTQLLLWAVDLQHGML